MSEREAFWCSSLDASVVLGSGVYALAICNCGCLICMLHTEDLAISDATPSLPGVGGVSWRGWRVKMLFVDETGCFEISVYGVNVWGLRLADALLRSWAKYCRYM